MDCYNRWILCGTELEFIFQVEYTGKKGHIMWFLKSFFKLAAGIFATFVILIGSFPGSIDALIFASSLVLENKMFWLLIAASAALILLHGNDGHKENKAAERSNRS